MMQKELFVILLWAFGFIQTQAFASSCGDWLQYLVVHQNGFVFQRADNEQFGIGFKGFRQQMTPSQGRTHITERIAEHFFDPMTGKRLTLTELERRATAVIVKPGTEFVRVHRDPVALQYEPYFVMKTPDGRRLALKIYKRLISTKVEITSDMSPSFVEKMDGTIKDLILDVFELPDFKDGPTLDRLARGSETKRKFLSENGDEVTRLILGRDLGQATLEKGMVIKLSYNDQPSGTYEPRRKERDEFSGTLWAFTQTDWTVSREAHRLMLGSQMIFFAEYPGTEFSPNAQVRPLLERDVRTVYDQLRKGEWIGSDGSTLKVMPKERRYDADPGYGLWFYLEKPRNAEEQAAFDRRD